MTPCDAIRTESLNAITYQVLHLLGEARGDLLLRDAQHERVAVVLAQFHPDEQRVWTRPYHTQQHVHQVLTLYQSRAYNIRR
jgi:hypothetical protein